MSGARFPYEPWTVTEDGFQSAFLRESESVFALGNGLIGMRGNLEELGATGAESIQGCYLNGVFDSEPIVYGESAYGYAKNHETICSVMDAKSLSLSADGEKLDLGLCGVTEHRRVLDMRAGLLRRSFVWNTKSGCTLRVETERLVSLTRQELAATRLRVRCEAGGCLLRVDSFLAPAVIAQGDPNDPRNSAGKDRSLRIGAIRAEGTLLRMRQLTKRSVFTINCAVEHRCAFSGEVSVTGERADWIAEQTLRAGDTLTLERSICYTATRDGEADRWDDTAAQARSAPAFDALCAEQRACLDAFWDRAGIDIEGDDALLQGLRFNLFHLFQSVGRDGRRNIAAKGLTGEGYEGHTFWDTEAYILPVFLYTEPTLARRLLESRYAILPKARERARIMGHPRGALFPWRSIDGEECSAYFPAGTAQYHIDGDIAHAVWEYWQATEDLDFLARCGARPLRRGDPGRDRAAVRRPRLLQRGKGRALRPQLRDRAGRIQRAGQQQRLHQPRGGGEFPQRGGGAGAARRALPRRARPPVPGARAGWGRAASVARGGGAHVLSPGARRHHPPGRRFS